MSAPWWTVSGAPARIVATKPAGAVEPETVEAAARAHVRGLVRRAPAFTPIWVPNGGDAGDALVRLFGAQLQPLLERLNKLPARTFVEFLRLAEIQQLAGGTAEAMLTFEATPGASPAFVPRNFQVGAQPADGSSGLVVFETLRDVYVSPGKVAEAGTRHGRVITAIADVTSGATFRPFGDRAIAGRAFLIGIEAEVAPAPTVSLGFFVAAAPGSPPPAAAGGVQPSPVVLAPVLEWEVLDGGTYVPAEVIVDETESLARSGIVELQPPRTWRPGRPVGIAGDTNLFWIRVRIGHGSYEEPPELSRVLLNVARASATETIRDETLEYVPGAENRMRVSGTPVVPDSIELEVDEGSATGDLYDDDEPSDQAVATDSVRRWTEVATLAAARRNDRVFTLDAQSGELTFGDGNHGARLPRGFRHVTARSYRVGGGARGAVRADEIKTLIRSTPFLRGASNPERASGGTDMELREHALLRGPQEIRARGRAVTERDFELMARRTPGAAVARAHAVSGLHPVLPGAPIPGVVGVFVVPAARIAGPPVADEQTLRAVANYLAGHVAPAGVEVVCAAPRFHRIRAEVRAQVSDSSADVGVVVRRLIEELNAYFDPITGGDDDRGWVFGGAIRYTPLLRRLLTRVKSASAISRINLVLDGARFASCSDVPISAQALLWPEAHEVTVEATEATI
jgi:predicted phage baseplate assembly protein